MRGQRFTLLSQAMLGLSLVLLLSVPIVARTATSRATLSVSVEVVNACTVRTDSLSFGVPYPLSAPATTALDTTGPVRVQCTHGKSGTVGLSQRNTPAPGFRTASPLRRPTPTGADRVTTGQQVSTSTDGSTIVVTVQF